ncbi:hypothetical protein AB4Y30_10855 [Ornithinibacillus sp. 4-3]|uniref:Translation initiation factor 2 n=1 Tax=Ornithinibacillus sp. 4-3 TaxID=3231488 RepID=A0AB39HLX1_9BACI
MLVEYNKQDEQSKLNVEDINIAYSLKLALLGGILSTIGDAIAAYSAKIAIDETIQEQLSQSNENNNQEERLKSMEKQIELLQRRLDELVK